MNSDKGDTHQSLCRYEADAFAINARDQNRLSIDLRSELSGNVFRRSICAEILAGGGCHDVNGVMLDEFGSLDLQCS